MGEETVVNITVKFGVANGRIYSVPVGTTIHQVINDQRNIQDLGYNPNGVRARLDGVEMDRNTRLSNGDVVSLETVGTSKA